MAARSRFLFPLDSDCSELLLSLITFSAIRLFLCLESRMTRDRFINSSIVSGFATGIKIFSGIFFLSSASSCASFIANLRAALSVANELMIQVNKIRTIVPFSTSSFNNRSPLGRIILYPTNTAAKVAAAWALLRPNISSRSIAFILYIFWVSHEAIHLLAKATVVITTATFNASPCPKSILISINIPTPIKK